MSLYDDLGVRPTATHDEIRRAFCRQARWLHPDVNPSRTADVRFRRLHRAYAVLRDPATRAEYDAEMRRRLAATRVAVRPPVRDVYRVEPWFREKPSAGERLEVWLMLVSAALLLLLTMTVFQ